MLAAASLVAAVAAAAVAVQPPPPRTNTDRLAMLDQAARKPLRVHANSQRRARGPSALKASVADRILFFLRACSKKQKDSAAQKVNSTARRSARLFAACVVGETPT